MPPRSSKKAAGKVDEATPHYLGHRDRLRARFAETAGTGMPDYEILELVLFAAIPRRDVKPIAKSLIDRFGSLAGVLSATPQELSAHEHIGAKVASHLKTIRVAGLRLLADAVMDQPVISNWSALLDYCRAAMAWDKTEHFRILFLDRKNRLMADEVQSTGTVDHTPVYPREVVKRALVLEASAIILVHNHPSGDPTPSKADIEMTRTIVKAAQPLGINVHDHIIIARAGHASFKTLGLL